MMEIEKLIIKVGTTDKLTKKRVKVRSQHNYVAGTVSVIYRIVPIKEFC